MSLPLIQYVLVAALRDKMVMSLLLILMVGGSLAVFLGGAAITETDQFTAVFAAGGLRVCSVLGLVLFTVSFVRRSFDSKDIEFLLSRPVGRLSILFSYSCAFSFLAILMSLAVCVAVFSVSPHMFHYGYVLWGVSIAVESIIMVNLALFFSMYLSSSATASLVTFAVYVLARMMGQLLGIVDSQLVDSSGPYAMALQLVSVITPRLDLMGQTSWLLYGVEEGIGLYEILLQGLFFSLVVLFAACLDFVRRQF